MSTLLFHTTRLDGIGASPAHDQMTPRSKITGFHFALKRLCTQVAIPTTTKVCLYSTSTKTYIGHHSSFTAFSCSNLVKAIEVTT